MHASYLPCEIGGRPQPPICYERGSTSTPSEHGWATSQSIPRTSTRKAICRQRPRRSSCAKAYHPGESLGGTILICCSSSLNSNLFYVTFGGVELGRLSARRYRTSHKFEDNIIHDGLCVPDLRVAGPARRFKTCMRELVAEHFQWHSVLKADRNHGAEALHQTGNG